MNRCSNSLQVFSDFILLRQLAQFSFNLMRRRFYVEQYIEELYSQKRIKITIAYSDGFVLSQTPEVLFHSFIERKSAIL